MIIGFTLKIFNLPFIHSIISLEYSAVNPAQIVHTKEQKEI